MDDLGEARFLTVPEAAELLRVNVGDVHQLIETGELAALRVGNRGPWRIELTVLEDFITEQYELARRAVAFKAGVFAYSDNISDF
jgi:excisionase family DNA binding protein